MALCFECRINKNTLLQAIFLAILPTGLYLHFFLFYVQLQWHSYRLDLLQHKKEIPKRANLCKYYIKLLVLSFLYQYNFDIGMIWNDIIAAVFSSIFLISSHSVVLLTSKTHWFSISLCHSKHKSAIRQLSKLASNLSFFPNKTFF